MEAEVRKVYWYNSQEVADLEFSWGRCEDVKISTEEIMREIDEGEDE